MEKRGSAILMSYPHEEKSAPFNPPSAISDLLIRLAQWPNRIFVNRINRVANVKGYEKARVQVYFYIGLHRGRD